MDDRFTELFDEYRSLSSLCFDCDAVAYGDSIPCFECETHKRMRVLQKEIDEIVKNDKEI